jgi:hypothetical protein
MKRNILVTAIGLILTFGSGTLYATCSSCRGAGGGRLGDVAAVSAEADVPTDVSPWQLFGLLLPAIFGGMLP